MGVLWRSLGLYGVAESVSKQRRRERVGSFFFDGAGDLELGKDQAWITRMTAEVLIRGIRVPSIGGGAGAMLGAMGIAARYTS